MGTVLYLCEHMNVLLGSWCRRKLYHIPYTLKTWGHSYSLCSTEDHHEKGCPAVKYKGLLCAFFSCAH